MPRLLDLTCPLDPDYPGNKGLVAAWVAVPELAAGLTLFDLLNTGRGNPNHGTLTNGPTWVSGLNGLSALQFDGVNDYVECGGGPLTFPAGVTATVRFRLNTTSVSYSPLLVKWDEAVGGRAWSIDLRSGPKIGSLVSYDGGYNPALDYTGGPTLVVGEWYTATMSYDPATGSVVYLNGQASASQSYGGYSLYSSTAPIRFGGSYYGNAWNYTNFTLGGGWVHNRPFSAAEVRDLYDQSRREWGQSDQYRWLDGVTYFLPGGGSVSGSASITDANDATTAAATVAVAASATITDATDTTAGAGTVSVTATASLTDATDATSSAATVAVAATASITDATDTATAAGAIAVTATAALTDADDGAAATGGSAGGGSASLVDADDAVAAVGAVAVAATASLTDATDTTSGAGAVAVSGSAALTDATDTTTAAATVAVAGSVALTDGGDTTTSAATVSVTAAAAISDATDTVTATASDGSTPVGDDTLYMFLAF